MQAHIVSIESNINDPHHFHDNARPVADEKTHLLAPPPSISLDPKGAASSAARHQMKNDIIEYYGQPYEKYFGEDATFDVNELREAIATYRILKRPSDTKREVGFYLAFICTVVFFVCGATTLKSDVELGESENDPLGIALMTMGGGSLLLTLYMMIRMLKGPTDAFDRITYHSRLFTLPADANTTASASIIKSPDKQNDSNQATIVPILPTSSI